MPDPVPALNRKPWPMKWIVVAIVVCIVPYTWITLKYRKANPAHLPYQDNKDRAQVMRLLDSGFQRVNPTLERLVDPPLPLSNAARIENDPGGLPLILRDLLIDKPAVPSNFTRIHAPGAALSGAPYEFSLACTQPNNEEQPVSSTLYLRGQEAIFIIGYEDLPGDLQARRTESFVRVVVPAHTFDSGSYRATLVGAQASRKWTFEVH